MGDNDHGGFPKHFSTLFIVSVPNIGTLAPILLSSCSCDIPNEVFPDMRGEH